MTGEFLDGLKLGKGCGFGHILEANQKHLEKDVDEVQQALSKWNERMMWLAGTIIALAVLSGINVGINVSDSILKIFR